MNKCDGCQSYYQGKKFECGAPGIYSRYKLFKEICPCTDCLVKVVCTSGRLYPYCHFFKRSRRKLVEIVFYANR